MIFENISVITLRWILIIACGLTRVSCRAKFDALYYINIMELLRAIRRGKVNNSIRI